MNATDARRCTECGEHKPLDDYYRHARGGYYARCKACHYIRTRANHLANIDKRRQKARERYAETGQKPAKRAAKRLKKYGLTSEGYDALIEQQRGLCPICLEPLIEPTGRLPRGGADWTVPSVDHCHDTGKVRGILHRRCNLAIEFLLPDDALARARTYLRDAGVQPSDARNHDATAEGEPAP